MKLPGKFAVGEIGCRWASLGQDIVHNCEQKNERETFVSGFNVAEIQGLYCVLGCVSLIREDNLFFPFRVKCDVEMKWSDSLSDYEVPIHFMPWYYRILYYRFQFFLLKKIYLFLVTLGFSCGTWDLSLWQASSICHTWAQLHCGMQDLSSWIRDRTHVPCTARQILSHWASR